MSSSFDHLIQYTIGLVCLLISNVFYFFYFNSVNSIIDKPFLVAYLQSILYIIVALLFCLFENSRFRLNKHNKRNRLLYSPLNQFEKSDMHLFEMAKLYGKKNDSCEKTSFLTDPVYELVSEEEEEGDDEEDEDDGQFKSKFHNKLNQYDEYLVKINERYDELTKEDVKEKKNKSNRDRKVKFSRKKEIRYLKGIYAQTAILSRFSYESFMQFNYQLLNQYSNLSFSNSISIVPMYAFIHFFSIYFTLLAMNYYFESINFFDLSFGFSLLFIILIQCFYFSPSFTEKITVTKTVVCLVSLLSLFLIKSSSTKPFLNLSTSDSIFLNQTTIDDSVDLYSIGCSSMIYTLLSSFLLTFFLVSLRNKYEQDDFDIKVFSLFLSLFTMIVFGTILLFVFNRRLAEPILPFKSELIDIMHQGLMGPCFGHFFLIIGCFYTNTMVAVLSISFILPINYSINLYSSKHLDHKLFLFSSFMLFVSFITLVYITFYEFAKSKRKDFLVDLFRKRFTKQIRLKKLQSQRVYFDEDFD